MSGGAKLYFVFGRAGGVGTDNEVVIRAAHMLAARSVASKFGSNVVSTTPELVARWAATGEFDAAAHRAHAESCMPQISAALGRQVNYLSVLTDDEVLKAGI